MSNCDKCGQPLPGAKPDNIQIAAKDKFQNLCRTLASMPSLAGEESMLSFLADVPGKVRKYGSLTPGQGRFFKAIHKKATDTWPPDWGEFQKEDAAQSFVAADDSTIPF